MMTMATEKQLKKTIVGKNGGKRKGAGRPSGTPNRVTIEFRDTVRRVLEDNSQNVGIWLEQVANGVGNKPASPEKALDLLAKLAEYAAPKLNRTEHVGEGGGPVKTVVSWEM
jgi:hypothetical protein